MRGWCLVLLLMGGCFDFGDPVETVSGVAKNEDKKPAPTGEEANVQVVLKGLKFNPPEVSIPVGGSVTFVMEDTGTFHEVFEGRPRGANNPSFSTMKLNIGEEQTVVFEEAGEWDFYCTNHSTTMRNGRVVVTE